ncbi:MAG TPA: hypothetical protein VF952_08935 [Chloroflexia bacterium]|jgi:hypothetical protein
MGNLSESLHHTLRRARLAIGNLLPFLAMREVESDPVADKLKDLNWADTEDDASAGRQANGQAPKGDGLAQTIYHARPQNPFGEDF